LTEGPAGGRAPRRTELLLRGAFVVSTTGDWVYRFALPLVVLEQTGSALSTAFTYILEVVPYVLIGLFAGAVADRADRRRLMVGCDLFAAVLMGLLAVVLITGNPPIWLLYLLALLLATSRPVYFPAFQGILVDRVAAGRRPGLNAWIQGTDSALNMLGPVLGVGVVVLIGSGVACAVDAISFALSALLVSRITAPSGGAGPIGWLEIARNLGGDFRIGVREILGSNALFWGTVLMTGANFAALAVESNLVFVTAGGGRAAETALGLVFAALGAGALAGATVAPALIRRFPVGRTLAGGMGLMAAALALPALAPTTVTIGIAMFLLGFATSSIVVPWYTFRQSIVPAKLIGRVTSVGRSLSFVSIPLGALFGSWLVTEFSAAMLFVVAGGLQAVVWLSTLLSPLVKAGRRVEGEQVTPAAGG
jgi:MFS family permease